MLALPDIHEAAVRLLFPFRIPLSDFPGTAHIWARLRSTGLWEQPRLPSGYAELDDNLHESLFAQRPNGMLYNRRATGIDIGRFALPDLPGCKASEAADSVGLFINPQGAGALGLVLEWTGQTPLRELLHTLTRSEPVLAWRDLMLQAVNSVCSGMTVERAPYPILACRFRTYETFLGAPDARLNRYDDALAAAALSIKPSESGIAHPPHLEFGTLNPYHRACVCDSGSAHFFLDSREEHSNPHRVTWGVTSYAWIAMHELLYRISAQNLLAEARTLLDSRPPTSDADPKEWDSRVDGLNDRLLQFLVYADVTRSGPWQPMREFHSMARKAIGAQESAARLKDTVATLQQSTASRRRESVAAGLLHLQKGLEWLEAIFVAYYALSITEHLGHAFHFSEMMMKIGLAGSIILGLGFVPLKRWPQVVVGVFAALLFAWLVAGIYWFPSLPSPTVYL